MSRVSKHDALIATLAYADVFDYALTRREILLWFMFYPIRAITIPKHTGFSVISRRVLRQEGKWNIAARAGRWLSLVPSIQLVGVTGGLAMNNAAAADDIDLFFVVAGGTLWVSRMLATIVMDILGLRRHPTDTSFADKVCLNMFMSESATALPPRDRDCFTAHEVLQMVPLWEQNGAYQRFLRSNRWVGTYLPNAWKEKKTTKVDRMYTSFPLVIFLLRLFEWPVKRLQLWYMARHRTREIITDTTLRFHPKDARLWVKRSLGARLGHYHIPLDKIFYAS
jgi:hypothetical protein